MIFRGGTRENLQSANVEILLEVGSVCKGELSEEPERLLELMPSIISRWESIWRRQSNSISVIPALKSDRFNKENPGCQFLFCVL